jgi:hypothetical protein
MKVLNWNYLFRGIATAIAYVKEISLSIFSSKQYVQGNIYETLIHQSLPYVDWNYYTVKLECTECYNLFLH